jgi:hypothetical protein
MTVRSMLVARLAVATLAAPWLGPLLGGTAAAQSAPYRTRNFAVSAPSDEIAERVGQLAEHYREQLAIAWLGEPMRNWERPCQIVVKVGRMGAGGATTFQFNRGEVYGWRMEVSGSLERILDSVLPHEVNHTIFASHFRRPLPRWADEGAATLTEHESEKNRQRMLLGEVMRSGERFPMRQLLAMKEYPSGGQRRVLTMYAQGWSLADYLVQHGGKTKFLRFLEDAHRADWDAAVAKHYGIDDVDTLETTWNSWVLAGSPNVKPDDTQFAAASLPPGTVVRGQSPEVEEFAAPSPPAIERPEPRELVTALLDDANPNGEPRTLREVVELDAWVPTPVDRSPRPEPLGAYRTPIRR